LALLIWRDALGALPIAVALVATLVASDLSFRFIEQGRWPSRSGVKSLSRLNRPIWGFGLALIVLLGGAIAIREDVIIHTGSFREVAMAFPPSPMSGTDVTDPLLACGDLGPDTHCINADADAPEIVIIGDSLAYRFLPAVEYVGKQHGMNVTMFWSGGCGIEFEQCPESVRGYLASRPIAAIVIAQNFAFASVYMNGSEADGGLTPACDGSVPITACSAHLKGVAEFTARAERGLSELTKITPHILMALPFPQQALTFPNCLTSGVNQGPVIQSNDVACGWTSVAWQQTRQGLIPNAVRKVVAPYPDVVVWDPLKFYCATGRCPTVINRGEVIMNDAIHMTLEASRFAIPVVEDFVASVTGAKSES